MVSPAIQGHKGEKPVKYNVRSFAIARLQSRFCHSDMLKINQDFVSAYATKSRAAASNRGRMNFILWAMTTGSVGTIGISLEFAATGPVEM
jgi:hypothetical protein